MGNDSEVFRMSGKLN